MSFHKETYIPFGISVDPSATPFSILHIKKFCSSVSLSTSMRGAETDRDEGDSY